VPLRRKRKSTFINFDNAASTPALKPVLAKTNKLLAWYSGVHRGTGYKSMISTRIFEHAHEVISTFAGADPIRDTVILVKNTTEAINKLSYRLNLSSIDVVISTMMEHHSNDLPWRRQGHLYYAELDDKGRLDIKDVEKKLRRWYPRVKLLTVCGASNVTGHINDIYYLAALAHEYGARILVDAAQFIPHQPFNMKPHDQPDHIDYVAFSGHKIYAPYGTGVLIGPRDTFIKGDPEYVGGGTVHMVGPGEVIWAGLPDREEAGSPNLVGAYALAETLKYIKAIGIERMADYEQELCEYAVRLMRGVKGLVIYGDFPRIGVISLNLSGINHSLLGAILCYEGGVGVRTGCFCAQTYVRYLMKRDLDSVLHTGPTEAWQMPGMVRISFGAYNTFEEVNKVVDLLADAASNPREYHRDYILDLELGAYRPRSGYFNRFDPGFE